jgi:protein TonB
MSLKPLDTERATRRIWPALLRWVMAALVVVSAHGSLAWFALSWRPNEAAAGAPEPAVMIELAAVSVAPEALPTELPPAPQPAETEPEPTPPEPEPEPVKEPEPPPPEPIPEPEPVQQPEPEIKLPELPQLPDPAAVLAPPPPPQIEKPKVVERKPTPPKPKPKVVERRKPIERQKPRAEQATAPPPSPAPAAAPSSAPIGTTATSSVSTASWRGMLIAHLNRYKRFPPGARTGTAQVAFSIDRGGRVLSARLTGSSGDPALDDEAVSMVRRASPVPAPPAGIGGGAIALAVPVRFNR